MYFEYFLFPKLKTDQHCTAPNRWQDFTVLAMFWAVALALVFVAFRMIRFPLKRNVHVGPDKRRIGHQVESGRSHVMSGYELAISCCIPPEDRSLSESGWPNPPERFCRERAHRNRFCFVRTGFRGVAKQGGWSSNPINLFRPERYNRIYSRRPPRRNRARRQSHHGQNPHHARQDQRIDRSHAVNLICHRFLQ
jgi:hypothetical protein